MIATRSAGVAEIAGMSRVLTASIIELCAADHLDAGLADDGPQATGRRVNGYPMRKQLVANAL